MFNSKPDDMALAMRIDITNKNGNANNNKQENHQPLKKAKKSPASDIARESWRLPTFSPKPFYIAWHSLASLEESSVTLKLSNQPISY